MKRLEDMDNRELLYDLARTQRQDLTIDKVTTIAVALMVAALIVSIVILVPRLMETIDRANATMSDTQQLIGRINTSLDTIDGITEKIDTAVTDTTDRLDTVIELFDKLDLDGLSKAIDKLAAIVEGLTNFKIFGN